MSSLLFPLAAMGARVLSRSDVSNERIDESNGRVVSSSWQMQTRTRYRVGFGTLRSDTRLDYQILRGFFGRHRGQLESFLIRDEEDCTAAAMGFGVGDGSTTGFQLQRSLCGKVYDASGLWGSLSTPRTNLCLHSQDLDHASWTKGSASVTADAALAPDGTATADKLVEAAATAQHYITGPTFATVDLATYTASIFVKAAGRTSFSLTGGQLQGAQFDLSAGTVTSTTTGVSASIYACGASGWYRCSITYSASGTSGSVVVQLSGSSVSYAGDGSSGLYLWGAQAEAGSTLTKYAATTTASVTTNPVYWTLAAGGGYADGFEPVWDVAPGPSIYIDGTLKTLTTHYSLSSTGLVTFVSAPSAAAVLTWSGSYYKRVRFAQPGMDLERVCRAIWRGDLELISEAP